MILQVINSLNIGGAEKYVIELSKQMQRSNEPVEILVFDRTKTAFSEMLQQDGITIRYTMSQKYFSPLNLITFLKVILSNRYSVIHTHLTYAQLWVAVVSLLNIRGKRLFTSEHSGSNNRRGKRLLKAIDNFIYSRYNKIFCISKTTKDNLIEWVKPKDTEKFLVVSNCVDVNSFKKSTPCNRSEFGLDNNDVVVMMTGRMCIEKDQPTLIRAVEIMENKYKCVLVGDGSTINDVKSCVSNPQKTIFTGTRTDISSLLKMCDIYVQSSHLEGLPTTILEAMAAKKVVFGSNVIGIRDILPKEQLFEHKNHTELAKMIESLTIDKQNEIISQQNKIVENYSVEKITYDILQQYKQTNS